RRAGGAHRGSGPHQGQAGVRGPARPQAAPPAAALRCAAAPAAVARARAAGRARRVGRHHGARRARGERRAHATAARLQGPWGEPPRQDASPRRGVSWPRRARAVPSPDRGPRLAPAVPSTRGIIDLDPIRKLNARGAPGGAYLINAGRGSLQVDADILAALDEGALSGATLDVFASEPLPQASPLWNHAKVTVTPHNAAQ